MLGEELDSIFDIDMTDFGFEDMTGEEKTDTEPKGKLTDEFLIPPLSVLDTKQGYWQDRKRMWKKMGLQSGLGRDEELLGKGLVKLAKNAGRSLTGTSIFDPVLCEVMYKWYNIENGSIYDCFAGGSVRGIVASKLGYDYTGIDLRQEQVDANYSNALEMGVEPKWYCDDSLNADKYIDDNSVDMIFSCPPYADLEVYSDDVRDISNMEYEDFKVVYRKIINIACRKLKDDRFAVFVVGDVRNKQGFYRNFIDYTKECFNANGLLTYNEAILLDMLGTSMIRAPRAFKAGRKLAKVHQNVLIFYKGDTSKIKENYKEIEVAEIKELIQNGK